MEQLRLETFISGLILEPLTLNILLLEIGKISQSLFIPLQGISTFISFSIL